MPRFSDDTSELWSRNLRPPEKLFVSLDRSIIFGKIRRFARSKISLLPLDQIVKQSSVMDAQLNEGSIPMEKKRLFTVAWISDFPVEWLPDPPTPLRSLPKQHPTTWQRVLLSEFENNSALRVHIIVLRKQIAADLRFERNGVIFHILKVPGGLRAPSFFWVDTFLIRRALKRIQPDLIHAWGTEKGAALIAARLPYQSVVTIQGLLTWYKELIPMVPYEHFATVFEQISLKRATIASTESSFAVAYLKKKYSNLQVHQAEHAPNWLFHQIQRCPQLKPLRFISVGTLNYRKGTDLLLRALDALSREMSLELILVSGRNRDYFNSVQSTLSPEFTRRIVFKADLSPSEIAAELSLATMLLMPTRADTSPNAVKEAVVAGVPVVASSVGGIPDYVFPEMNGILFESGDLSGLTQAIRSACVHPLFSKGLVNEETLARTREYLSPKKMAENFLSIYETAMTQRPRFSVLGTIKSSK